MKFIEKIRRKKEIKRVNNLVMHAYFNGEGPDPYEYYLQSDDEDHYVIERFEEDLKGLSQGTGLTKSECKELLLDFFYHIKEHVPYDEESFKKIEELFGHGIYVTTTNDKENV